MHKLKEDIEAHYLPRHALVRMVAWWEWGKPANGWPWPDVGIEYLLLLPVFEREHKIYSSADVTKHQELYSTLSLRSGHTIQAIVITNLNPPAIHNGICILLVASDIKPPATAPTRIPKNASTLLFLLIFIRGGANSFGSVTTSWSIEVRTTVGISAKFKVRLPTIWPAAWKLSRAIGNSDLQSMSSEMVSRDPLTIPACTIAAATRIITDWRRKDATRVPRREGPSERDVWEKRKHPKQKQTIEVRDLAQPNGLEVSWGVAPPRPKKMVLPGVTA